MVQLYCILVLITNYCTSTHLIEKDTFFFGRRGENDSIGREELNCRKTKVF